jgi:hypothetical protein
MPGVVREEFKVCSLCHITCNRFWIAALISRRERTLTSTAVFIKITINQGTTSGRSKISYAKYGKEIYAYAGV